MNALAPIAAHAAASALADRAALLRAADIAALVVERRNTYPILANVRLRGDGNVLFLTATDLDIMIDVAVPCAADHALDVTVPAFTLKDLLKGAPKAADMVALTMPAPVRKTRKSAESYIDPESGEEAIRTVETEYFETEQALTVDFDSAKYHLGGLSSADFPGDMRGPVAKDSKGNPVADYRRFTLPGADLFATLDSVAFAISNEETRYYLNGIYFHVVTPSGRNMPELRAVATDGHRMARHSLVAPDGSLDMPGVIIPKATVYLLQKLLKPAKGAAPVTVEIEVCTTHMRFMFGGVTVTSKMVEGTFPDYERVTPKNNDKHATFPVAAMLESMKAVTLIASERGGKAVKLALEAGTCTMTVTNPDHGTAESSFPITQDFDGYFEIGFNARYLAESVAEAAFGGDDVTLAFNDAGSPTVITAGSGRREDWLGVLMPMRV